MLPRNLSFTFDNAVIEIVTEFTYLGVVFTSGGSFTKNQNMLAGQARKEFFMLEKYVYKLTTLTVNPITDLFDKLILPILNYFSEVWGLFKQMQFNEYIFNFAKSSLELKRAHNIISFLENLVALRY